MNKRNSINAPTVIIGLKTKTKLNDTKILSTFDVIPGHARPCRVIQRLFMNHQRDQVKQTLVDIVERIFRGLAFLRLRLLGLRFPLRQSEIGIFA
jgi:hypothetical protein